MNQDLFNQVPVLEGLYRYLEQLSIMEVPIKAFENSKVLVHQIPDLTLEILKDDAWVDMGKQQREAYIAEPQSSKEAFTSRWAS
jgi:hypothetical protein